MSQKLYILSNAALIYIPIYYESLVNAVCT